MGNPDLGVKVPKFAETDPVAFTALNAPSQDNVIEHLDMQELARADEVAGDFDIGFARSRIAAGMIMHKDHSGGTLGDCWREDFASMD